MGRSGDGAVYYDGGLLVAPGAEGVAQGDEAGAELGVLLAAEGAVEHGECHAGHGVVDAHEFGEQFTVRTNQLATSRPSNHAPRSQLQTTAEGMGLRG